MMMMMSVVLYGDPIYASNYIQPQSLHPYLYIRITSNLSLYVRTITSNFSLSVCVLSSVLDSRSFDLIFSPPGTHRRRVCFKRRYAHRVFSSDGEVVFSIGV